MKLSVIIPVFNEEKTILTVLKKLLKQREVYEVIVVDDGSTDKTQLLLRKFKLQTSSLRSRKEESNYASIQLSTRKQTLNKWLMAERIKIFHKKNSGKGSAVRLGLTKVTGTHVLIQDADLEYDPEDIPTLLKPIRKGTVDVVYGSRFLGPHLNLLFWHRVGNSFLNFLVNILYNTTLSDMETCYKVVPTALLKEMNLKENDFRIEPEITCKLLKRDIKIYEVPISYVGRDFSQGKKITWWDGVLAVGMIVKLKVLG